MVVLTLETKQDRFCLKEDEEEVLEPEVPNLSAICALLYLAQCTRPDTLLAMNLLTKYSSTPTCRHWNHTKDILLP